jgi:hypothetical protein
MALDAQHLLFQHACNGAICNGLTMFLFYPPHSLDAESGCKEADQVGKLPGLKEYTGISSMLGYPGRNSLFGAPVPLAKKNDQGALPMGEAAVRQVAPTLLGCISETTGAHASFFSMHTHRCALLSRLLHMYKFSKSQISESCSARPSSPRAAHYNSRTCMLGWRCEAAKFRHHSGTLTATRCTQTPYRRCRWCERNCDSFQRHDYHRRLVRHCDWCWLV